MEIRVRHQTTYRYDQPVRHGVMLARLWPGNASDQKVLSWRVEAPGRFEPFDDHHGNKAATLSIETGAREVHIIAEGVVETLEQNGIRPLEAEGLPLGSYLRVSPYCRPDAAIRSFIAPLAALLSEDRLKGLHELMLAINREVAFREAVTEVTTTAAEALAAGEGVCQDHAHLFIACCRLLGVPARYVSGYLAAHDGGHGTHGAGHAWAEAFLGELGWVSFDPANAVSANQHYLRLAQGFDYADAGPLRGVRRGGGGEELSVQIQIGANQ